MPWQRVINAEGRISIRHLRHAAEEQRSLLEAEGIEFDSRGFIDWQRFGWEGLSAVEVEALLNCECVNWELSIVNGGGRSVRCQVSGVKTCRA